MRETRPFKLPDAWPMDGQSRMKCVNGLWIIGHAQRAPMAYKDGEWVEIERKESAA